MGFSCPWRVRDIFPSTHCMLCSFLVNIPVLCIRDGCWWAKTSFSWDGWKHCNAWDVDPMNLWAWLACFFMFLELRFKHVSTRTNETLGYVRYILRTSLQFYPWSYRHVSSPISSQTCKHNLQGLLIRHLTSFLCWKTSMCPFSAAL